MINENMLYGYKEKQSWCGTFISKVADAAFADKSKTDKDI